MRHSYECTVLVSSADHLVCSLQVDVSLTKAKPLSKRICDVEKVVQTNGRAFIAAHPVEGVSTLERIHCMVK